MAAVAAWQWRVEGLLIRVSFGLGLLVKEIRPPVRHPLHVMAVTYMENMACSCGLIRPRARCFRCRTHLTLITRIEVCHHEYSARCHVHGWMQVRVASGCSRGMQLRLVTCV